VNEIAASEFRQAAPIVAPEATRSPIRRAAASFWLNALFWQAGHAPWVGRVMKRFALWSAFRYSKVLREVTAANARRIFGPGVSTEESDAYFRRMIENYFDFITDIARSLRLSRDQLHQQIAFVRGEDAYFAARAAKKGAIIATAHMGSFEVGAVGLLDREKTLHVVFKRDETRFEQVRSALRQKLGVVEAPIDDGFTVWLKLREALQRNEIVMVQADRVMPGQKGCKIPFLHGHILLPTGPVKLAMASGAPMIPIFALRNASGQIDIHIEPPIWAEPSEQSPHPALLQIAAVLEKYVRAYPDQWLLFHPAFCEDAA
jgi:KDO2-lipid IV(A) lauroyltransferase